MIPLDSVSGGLTWSAMADVWSFLVRALKCYLQIIITYNLNDVGAETNCGIAHILGILLRNSYEFEICSEARISEVCPL